MSKTMTALNDELFTHLQQQSFVLLHTTDAELGRPTSSAISWIYAPTRDKLRFAIDTRSSLSENLEANPHVCVTVFASGGVYTVHGRAVRVVPVLEDVPFEVSCFDIEIDSWRNAMYAGSRLAAAPVSEKTYDQRAADKLDGQVFDAMRKA
ncbi:pyridoxamine 5'-phosphate oxidase family protein [Paenibacillus daejeonensis]|uniref:pyridoxamine 5'-phosphate oxidase family protein n=1 Tax=Paenibacillus daejeonensis TaxID=135193 RepID=UPI00036D5063|nr:pyridoxamine 5'-phosphate oxidase family protein [Paenibacillus daejeonensis]